MLAAVRTDRRRFDRSLLVASLAIAVGLALIVWGLTVAVTGDERDPLPDAIEAVTPPPDAEQVPQQAGFVVDLESGYEGSLTIDGIEIPVVELGELGSAEAEPGKQIDVPSVAVYQRGNGIISFTPSDRAPIDTLSPGTHETTVTYWKTAEGRSEARSYSWRFEVV